MSAAEPEVINAEPEAEGPSKKHSRQIVKRENNAIAARAPGIEDLMTQAIATGNMDTIERVFALRQELKAEAAREAFYAALSDFQRECPIIKKTKIVPFKGGQGCMYRYAPLDKIVEKVGPLLTKHGLSYTIKARIELRENSPFMVAELSIFHSQGHVETSDFPVPLDKSAIDATNMNDAQRYGSASTYAKRNVFQNGFGILTGDSDDDGAGATYTPNEVRAARQPVSQPRATPTAQRAEEAKQTGNGEKKQIHPAAEQEATIEESTIKVITKKMESGALSITDFQKRFPAFLGIDNPIPHIKRTDVNPVINWLADPTTN